MLIAGALSVALAIASVVGSSGEVVCSPHSTFCVIDVGTPGAPAQPAPPAGGGSGIGTERRCVVSATGVEVSCQSPLGWFNDRDDCYWRKLDVQPPATDVIWAGHHPEGAIYSVSCVGTQPGGRQGWVWSATEPPGYGGTSITPQQLAQRAMSLLELAGPTIRLTIGPDETGVVGVPVWLWTDVTSSTWGPASATASVPGLSVTATAKARHIVWSMGDGRSETCASPGTPYIEGGVTSPTCQHIYDRPSTAEPNGAFPITATTTWDVTWSGGGASGALTVTRQSAASVRIDEVQVLVTQQ